MAYGRRRFRKRRSLRSGDGFGGAVGDMVDIAANFDPRGALITGGIGFVLFYFIVPELLSLWVSYSKTQMSTEILSATMKQLLDDISIRRFIHPSKWAAIAILIGCMLIACWKALTRTDLNYQSQRDMTWFAKLLARFLD